MADSDGRLANPTQTVRARKEQLANETKQVIVMRKDLNMRKGKMIAQGSHASMAFMSRRVGTMTQLTAFPNSRIIEFSQAELDWLAGSFKKICVGVDSEEELLDIALRAEAAGLEVHMVTDSGLTEFGGVPTRTCLAIGPDEGAKIDPVTGHLKLL